MDGEWVEVYCFDFGRPFLGFVAPESGFEMIFFFLFMSYLRSLGLVRGGGPVPLSCYLILS